jgi:6-phosphofructokinase 2
MRNPGGKSRVSGKARIATLTLNPAIDISSETETVRHTHKVRTRREAMEPGGGGINVARVLDKLGADVTALFLGGGATGQVLDALLERAGIAHRMIEISGDSRISLAVLETSTGREFRFVPEGPQVTDDEAVSAIDTASETACDYLVASGSLPRGVPDDFYATLCTRAKAGGARFVLDTSGAALEAALDAGGLFLVKPSRREFENFVGGKLSNEQLASEASRLVASGAAENVAISQGREGALRATRQGAVAAPAIPVEACSTVGAGDSFLAGVVYGFSLGLSSKQAFRAGLAAGAAAVLSCGSELARQADLDRLVGAALSGEEVDHLGRASDGL